MSTGASRDTREISPKMNSSATRSATTVTVTLRKCSTIFDSRSVSLPCFIVQSGTEIISRALSRARGYRAQQVINKTNSILQIQRRADHMQRLQQGRKSPEIDRVLLGRDKAVRHALP